MGKVLSPTGHRSPFPPTLGKTFFPPLPNNPGPDRKDHIMTASKWGFFLMSPSPLKLHSYRKQECPSPDSSQWPNDIREKSWRASNNPTATCATQTGGTTLLRQRAVPCLPETLVLTGCMLMSQPVLSPGSLSLSKPNRKSILSVH